ncbi:MAG TPA: ABC transporter ATP-binding protein [Victivallales bacterium]|nr:ABC transporter ATP-binding protein [Victivallales bacterium]
MNIKSGNICGLLGKNGAGKSTLLYLIAGLLISDKKGIKVNMLTPSKRNSQLLKNCFLLPEKLYVPSLTGKQYLKLYAPFYPLFSHDQFEILINEFELDIKKKLTKMSFGQKKKFLLAFAFSTNCSLLLLDEPTNGLDIPSKKQFRKALISSFNEEQLILISTHQVRDLENLIDPIVILDDGKIIFNHSLEEIEDKLVQVTTNEQPSYTSNIYYEKSIEGYTYLTEDKLLTDESKPIDIEFLFNSVVDKNSKIEEILSGKEVI